MKKLLLISLILCFGAVVFSQESTTVKDKYRLAKFDDGTINRATDDATNFNNPVSLVKSSAALSPSETNIGITWYDLFSNFNIGNRFWAFEDGTLAGVWIFGLEASAFPDRGTGYNYYNGTEWGPQPTVRVENIRCGWPNITAWGPDGEMGVAHNGISGIEIIQRETKGAGEWTQTNFLGPEGIAEGITWPRMIGSGVNNEYSHIYVNTHAGWEGQVTTNIYSRSDNGGDTWDPHNIVLPETGDEYYIEITQDKCVMASNGNTICILYPNAYSDLFYVRSDDNGDTWEKQIVWEHPIPFYDPNVSNIDTIFVPDFSGHMAIDNQGHAHVVFGITRYINDAGGSGFYAYNPAWEGIAYWNDLMEPFSSDYDALAPPGIGFENSELVEDVTYIGWMQDVDGDGEVTLDGVLPLRTYGMSTQPGIHVDDQGRRFLIYSSNTETYVYTGGPDPINYKHIWGRAFANTVWGEFMDLTGDIVHVFDDCVYPMIGNNSDDNIHYIYQTDISPGNALDGDHDYQENIWVYGMLPKSDLITGISDKEIIDDSHVSQNFPNPFTGTTTVNVILEKAAELSLVVTNMTGQKVIEINRGHAPAQTYTFTIDAANLQAGIYFYTVTAGDSQVTRKMIVE